MVRDEVALWWETITGPLRLVDHLAACLNSGKSIVLHGAECLPWLEELRDYVAHKVVASQVEHIHWSGVCTRDSVVPSLLRRISPQDMNLCPPDEKKRIDYLKAKNILAKWLIWVTPCNDEELSGVVSFISDYRGKNLNEHGVFVVEVPERVKLSQLSGSVEILHCKEYVTETDMRLFATILAEGIADIPAKLKGYAAQIVAGLVGTNACWVGALLRGIDFECEDPIRGAGKVWGCDLLDKTEEATSEYYEHLLWKAQLQTAFSGIEMERRALIRQYWELIQRALTEENWDPRKDITGYVTQFKERIVDPYDLEYGSLIYMKGLKLAKDRECPLIPIFDSKWWDRVFFFHDCRNKLAHHNVCSPESLSQLLKLIDN